MLITLPFAVLCFCIMTADDLEAMSTLFRTARPEEEKKKTATPATTTAAAAPTAEIKPPAFHPDPSERKQQVPAAPGERKQQVTAEPSEHKQQVSAEKAAKEQTFDIPTRVEQAKKESAEEMKQGGKVEAQPEVTKREAEIPLPAHMHTLPPIQRQAETLQMYPGGSEAEMRAEAIDEER